MRHSCLHLFTGTGAILFGLSTPLSTAVAQVKPRKPTIRISKKTTYFLGPVRKDGTINYAAALNARASRDVTSANNAVALIIQVCSKEEFSDELLKGYYEKLGISKPGKKRRRMLTMKEFAIHAAGEKSEEYLKQLQDDQDKSTAGPWSNRDLPKLAAWLKHNEKPLDDISEALRRPKWYFPILIDKKNPMLIGAPLPMVQTARSISRALTARALLAIYEGRADDAIRDILTSHKLSRSVGRGPFIIDALVGYAIEFITCKAEEQVLQTGKLNEKQLRRLAQALAELPPLPLAAKRINLTERCVSLDAVQHVARSGPKSLEEVDAAPPLLPEKLFKVIVISYAQIDWNVVLEALNEEFDRMYAAMKEPTHIRRKAARAKFRKRLLSRRETLTPKLADEITVGGKVDRAKLSQAVGIVLISLFTPALMQVDNAEHRNVTRFQVTQLAVALERYRKAHDHFPPKLADLQPRFLKKIPLDPYSGKPLIYKPTKTGYLLYAIGENGKDDGGRTFDSEPPADDIVVRIKLAK